MSQEYVLMPIADDGNNADGIFAGGIVLGLIGGLVSTVMMDLVMVAVLSIGGTSADVFFIFIGDAAGAFLSMAGMAIDGGFIPGLIVHYLVGPLFGIIFAFLIRRQKVLRINNVGRCMLLGVFFTEIMSLLLLIPAVLILKLPQSDIIKLFGLALVFHAIWGMVLGAVISRGRQARA